MTQGGSINARTTNNGSSVVSQQQQPQLPHQQQHHHHHHHHQYPANNKNSNSSSRSSSWYRTVFRLTPQRAAFMHLVLLGIPVRFGLFLTGWASGWHNNNQVVDSWIPPPSCAIFQHGLIPDINENDDDTRGLAEVEEQGEATTMTSSCSFAETFAIRDFGVRFTLYYELAWVVWYLLMIRKASSPHSATGRKNNSNNTNTTRDAAVVAQMSAWIGFHRVLLSCAFASLTMISWMQHYDHRTTNLRYSEEEREVAYFEPTFYNTMVLCHTLAIGLSSWTLLAQESTTSRTGARHLVAAEEEEEGEEDSLMDDDGEALAGAAIAMKWSIPGNAIFCGAVINIFIATASFQALFVEESGVEDYYVDPTVVTPRIRRCFGLAALYTLLHGILLLRMRAFLGMPRLRSICLYKVVVNLVLPFFWFPDGENGSNLVAALLAMYSEQHADVLSNPHTFKVDHRITYAIRLCLTSIYLFGYLWAGQAEGFSIILSSEKED